MIKLAMLISTTVAIAQSPPPPPPQGHGTTGTNVPGGDTPIGSGLLILVALGAGFGAFKLYQKKKKLD